MITRFARKDLAVAEAPVEGLDVNRMPPVFEKPSNDFVSTVPPHGIASIQCDVVQQARKQTHLERLG